MKTWVKILIALVVVSVIAIATLTMAGSKVDRLLGEVGSTLENVDTGPPPTDKSGKPPSDRDQVEGDSATDDLGGDSVESTPSAGGSQGAGTSSGAGSSQGSNWSNEVVPGGVGPRDRSSQGDLRQEFGGDDPSDTPDSTGTAGVDGAPLK